MSYKTFLFSTLAILFASLFIISCSDNIDDLSTTIESRSSAYTADYVNTNTRKFAKNAKKDLAREISCLVERNSRVLNVFLNKCNESKSNGHYEDEFFWNIEKDKILLNGKSLSELLIEQNSNNESLLSYICQQIPACTILKLGNDNSEQKSNKIYYDDGFDDSDKTASIGYFQNCSEGYTPISNEPDVTTFVVRECETYISQEDLNSERHNKTKNGNNTIGSSCGNQIIVYSCLDPNCDQGTSSGPVGGPGTAGTGGCSEPCERDCDDGTENIRRFRTRDDYESWRGAGEFYIYSIFASDVTWEESDDAGEVDITGGALDYVIHRYDGVEDDNEFVYPDFEIIFWDVDEDGNRMIHVWYEDDGGGERVENITLSFEILGTGVSWPIPITYRSRDDLIGSSIVEYCQNIDSDGFEYHPSNDVDFYMNER